MATISRTTSRVLLWELDSLIEAAALLADMMKTELRSAPFIRIPRLGWRGPN
jgi:hypothetical protein